MAALAPAPPRKRKRPFDGPLVLCPACGGSVAPCSECSFLAKGGNSHACELSRAHHRKKHRRAARRRPGPPSSADEHLGEEGSAWTDHDRSQLDEAYAAIAELEGADLATCAAVDLASHAQQSAALGESDAHYARNNEATYAASDRGSERIHNPFVADEASEDPDGSERIHSPFAAGEASEDSDGSEAYWFAAGLSD